MVRGRRKNEQAPEPVDRINIEIGKRIRARRHELKMTQTVLARKVGVSQQQIVKYEKGIGRIPADKWIALGELLQLDTASLYRPLDDYRLEVSGFAEEGAAPFIVDAISDRDTVSLMRAFAGITDKTLRKKILDLVTTLASAPNDAKSVRRGKKGP